MGCGSFVASPPISGQIRGKCAQDGYFALMNCKCPLEVTTQEIGMGSLPESIPSLSTPKKSS